MDDKPVKKKKPRGKARLIPGKCIACGARCQISCPADAIEMNDKGEPIIDVDKCIGCVKGVKVCPAEALEMVYPAEEEMPLFVREETAKTESEEEEAATNGIEAWKGVWVFVEQSDGKAHPVSWELLGVGKNLAHDLVLSLPLLSWAQKSGTLQKKHSLTLRTRFI